MLLSVEVQVLVRVLDTLQELQLLLLMLRRWLLRLVLTASGR